MGAGHPSLTQKKDRRDEIEVRSGGQARRPGGLACEEAGVAIFGAAEGGEHLTVFHIAGIPLVSASFKSDSRGNELQRPVASLLEDTFAGEVI